jgi:hypothetical protein
MPYSPIDLTKQQLEVVLAEFEENFPYIGRKVFEPDSLVTSFYLQKINMEASRMLRFMNIGQYVPLVRIEDLSKKSAVGLAYIGDYGDKVFEIEIDERAIRDRDYAYRVLAHEICHKYLELFGLFSKVDRLKFLKCQKCYHYFVWDGRPLKLKLSEVNNRFLGLLCFVIPTRKSALLAYFLPLFEAL